MASPLPLPRRTSAPPHLTRSRSATTRQFHSPPPPLLSLLLLLTPFLVNGYSSGAGGCGQPGHGSMQSGAGRALRLTRCKTTRTFPLSVEAFVPGHASRLRLPMDSHRYISYKGAEKTAVTTFTLYHKCKSLCAGGYSVATSGTATAGGAVTVTLSVAEGPARSGSPRHRSSQQSRVRKDVRT
jgi:hypothetical protein